MYLINVVLIIFFYLMSDINKTSQHNMCFTAEKMLLENEMADMTTRVWLQIIKFKTNYCNGKVNCVYILNLFSLSKK